MTARREDDLARIRAGLVAAGEALADFTPGAIEVEMKRGGDPVTAADKAVNEVLLKLLPQDDEGWLSEETRDDPKRLGRHRVWVVDPVDGTREFIQGIPEWCVSIGLVEDGRAVAGGIYSPTAEQLFLGSLETGVTLNGRPASPSRRTDFDGCVVLASRSEINRGEWEEFANEGFEVKPTGSVALKLALVSAGLADVTWTLVPKHEWDVAAGAALLTAAGGSVVVPGADGSVSEPVFNRPKPLFPGFVATPPGLTAAVHKRLGLGV